LELFHAVCWKVGFTETSPSDGTLLYTRPSSAYVQIRYRNMVETA